MFFVFQFQIKSRYLDDNTCIQFIISDQLFSDKLLMDIRAKLFHTQLRVKKFLKENKCLKKKF